MLLRAQSSSAICVAGRKPRQCSLTYFQMATPTEPAYLLRGRARELLGKTTVAIQDYETVMKWPAGDSSI